MEKHVVAGHSDEVWARGSPGSGPWRRAQPWLLLGRRHQSLRPLGRRRRDLGVGEIAGPIDAMGLSRNLRTQDRPPGFGSHWIPGPVQSLSSKEICV